MMNEILMNGGGGDDDHELLQAQALIWNNIFNFVTSVSLKCAVELGIPDIIHNHGGKAPTVSELIQALGMDKAKAPFVHNIMRILTHSVFFVRTKINKKEKEESEDYNYEFGYGLAPASRLLLKEHPLKASLFLKGIFDPIMTGPCLRLSDWARSDDPSPFVTSHGMEFWEMTRKEPRVNKFFNESMAWGSGLISGVVIENHKQVFEGLNSVVDVGGGTGNMGKAVAEAFPEMKCKVLDLPQVVEGLKGTHNLSYVEGNMFQSIPPSQAVLLKNVLHDWSDEDCVKILKKCKEAIPSKENGGKVIIIEMVLDDDDEDDEELEEVEKKKKKKKNINAGGGGGGDEDSNNNQVMETRIQDIVDMFMIVMVNGRQRSKKEWAKLFIQAGFSDYKILPIVGTKSIIELYYN